MAGAFDKWIPKCKHTHAMFSCQCPETDRITGTEKSWVFSSAYLGEKELEFEMLETGSTKYTVRLYFVDLDDVQSVDRLFDVSLQGKTVLEGFDVIAEAGSLRRCLTKTFPDVTIDRKIRIELKSRGKRPPVLSGFDAKQQSQ
jgi:hypothetical protein